MAHAKAKVDAGFEFMEKLGLKYFCFHDIDLIPEAATIDETNARLDEITDYVLEKMKRTQIRCLWGTANMFSNPPFHEWRGLHQQRGGILSRCRADQESAGVHGEARRPRLCVLGWT